jgi:nucleoside-diphosphate-sugar epimerase
MKIAITGAAGVIGSRLAAELAHDHEIVRLDIAGDTQHVDVRDLDTLTAAFAGCETVVHLAGHPHVDTSWDDIYDVNIRGTYNAYEAAHRAKVKRVIFASSNHAVGMIEEHHLPAIYEPAAGIVVGIDAEIQPDSYYGVSKVFGEALGRYYSDKFGLQVACVRIGSITAPDDPAHASVANSSFWLPLDVPQKYKRYAATWMSQADFARLVRCIIARDVPFAIVYGVSDNPTRFWDLEPGRAIYGFWPQDSSAKR